MVAYVTGFSQSACGLRPGRKCDHRLLQPLMASRRPPPVRGQSGSGIRGQPDEPSPSHSKFGPAGIDAIGAKRGPPQMTTRTELWLFTVSLRASALGGMLGTTIAYAYCAS